MFDYKINAYQKNNNLNNAKKMHLLLLITKLAINLVELRIQSKREASYMLTI